MELKITRPSFSYSVNPVNPVQKEIQKLVALHGDLKREHRTTTGIRPANFMVNLCLQMVHFRAGRVARAARPMGALITDGSANSQLSKLWCGCFIRLAAVSILRVEAGGGRLSVVLCHDVHWQQALSALRRVGNSARAGRAFGNALPAMQGRYVIGADRRSDYARVRKVRRGLAGCGGL